MEPCFAVDVETGPLPVLMAYNVKEVQISWINRTPDWVSSFRLNGSVAVTGGAVSIIAKIFFKRGTVQSTRG